MVATIGLTGCRLDTQVRVEMDGDGTGTVTVTAVADAELAQRFPDVVDDLRLSDAESAGWVVDGPAATDGGGATIELTHEFTSAKQATALLRSLGGPMGNVRLVRRVTGEGSDATAANGVRGTTVVRGGFAAFADQALIDAAGGTPFARQLRGLAPSDTMSLVLDVRLPGSIEGTNGERQGDTVRWTIPLDGSRQPLELDTSQQPPPGSAWAAPVATLALVALVAWLALSLGFICYVLVRRSRRPA